MEYCEKINKLLGEVVELSVLKTGEEIDFRLMVTPAFIVTMCDHIPSISWLEQYATKKSATMIQDINESRYFRTALTLEKYKLFHDMYEKSLSLDHYVSELWISYSTAVDFRRIYLKIESEKQRLIDIDPLLRNRQN